MCISVYVCKCVSVCGCGRCEEYCVQERRLLSGSVDSGLSPLIEQSPPASSKRLFGQLRPQAETEVFLF